MVMPSEWIKIEKGVVFKMDYAFWFGYFRNSKPRLTKLVGQDLKGYYTRQLEEHRASMPNWKENFSAGSSELITKASIIKALNDVIKEL